MNIKTIGIVFVAVFKCGPAAPAPTNTSHFKDTKFGCHPVEKLGHLIRKAMFQRYVLSVDVAQIPETLNQ
jgi:hypothetical protein